MPSSIFTDVLKTVSKSWRERKNHAKRTFEWYQTRASEVRKAARGVDPAKVDPRAIMTANPERLSKKKIFANNMMGKLMCFYYDPKGKKTLPYYDTFPLVFPIKVMDDGRLMAINCHYLNPHMRAVLMNRLYSLLEDEKDGGKRLALSYEVLQSAAKYKYFKPCLKSYLISHVRSKFLVIDPKEWTAALFLPTARFEGATEAKVWADSMEKIKNS